jgi:hypothetical protein
MSFQAENTTPYLFPPNQCLLGQTISCYSRQSNNKWPLVTEGGIPEVYDTRNDTLASYRSMRDSESDTLLCYRTRELSAGGINLIR